MCNLTQRNRAERPRMSSCLCCRLRCAEMTSFQITWNLTCTYPHSERGYMRDGGNLGTRVSARELTELLGKGRPVGSHPGDHLMLQGEEGDCVIVLRSGVVKIMNTDYAGGVRLLA